MSLADGLTAIPGTTWNGLPANSSDGGNLNDFNSQLAPFVDQQAFALPALFTGEAPAGSMLNYLLFVEITAFEGQNELELCQGGGGCSSVFAPSDSPGATEQTFLSSANQYLFKLTNGFGQSLYSDASLNNDLLNYFVAFKVVQAGNVTVTPVNASGVPVSVLLNLQVGDLLIGVEDFVGPLPTSDRDFNDLFFQVRSAQAVPEPMTLTLLGLGALGAFATRRLRSKRTAA